MSELDLDEVTRQLQKTSVGSSGVSFQGKSLKLNTEDDAAQVVEAIRECSNLHYLNMEGNSLGVDAAKAIAKGLESHGEFKRALWKDMFTGRMKTEIPKALQFLGSGLMLAGARLTELDLSDNALGPIGVEGLVALLRSPTCYSLEILKLNNDGLGITGGKMLAKGLLDCYEKSKGQGKPLALRVFIAGRNRLENDGATALAEVFRRVGTLEELQMPQNGIYHVGITALANALKCNPNLEVLNLNDNTVTPRGVKALVTALPVLQKLRVVDFGDCLLRTKGAVNLAEALTDGHTNLEKLLLESNEIGSQGGLKIAKAMKNKDCLKELLLDGNQFGEEGRLQLTSELEENGRIEVLGSLEDDEEDEDDEEEGEGEDDDDDNDDNNDGCDDNSDSEHESAESEQESIARMTEPSVQPKKIDSVKKEVNVVDFIENPISENFLALGENRSKRIWHEVSQYPEELFLDKFFPVLMKVSAFSACQSEKVREAAFSCSTDLYEALFKWAGEKNKFSLVNNSLLVYLGLIKSEDKSLKLTWHLQGCMTALDAAMTKSFFPKDTQEIVNVFRGRRVIDVEKNKVISL